MKETGTRTSVARSGRADTRQLFLFVATCLAVLTASLAIGVVQTEARGETTTGGSAGDARAAVRGADSILGNPRYTVRQAKRYARSIGASEYMMKAIPLYYRIAPKAGIAPDVLVAQSMVETGNGHYGGDSKPWNMAGIKKGGLVGDEPRDFERPRTAYEGVRMHVNHMAAYTNRRPVGKPHDRYYDARSAQQSRGYWVRNISQLGSGVWATDPSYAGKIRTKLNEMSRY